MEAPKPLFIPFGELRPDLGDFFNTDLIVANGCFPYGDRYMPLQPLQKMDDETIPAATATVRHGHVNVNPPSGSPRVYLNINDAFHVFDTSSVPWSRSSVTMSGTGTDAAEGDYGGFLGFGQHEVYWQGHNKLPRIRLAGAGDFIDLCTTPAGANAPMPRFMAAIGDRLLMGSIGNTVAAGVGTPDPDPDMLWWSGSRNGRLYGTEASHPADSTGYTFLRDDLGPITGLYGSSEYALAFKRRGLWRMDFQGAFGNNFRVMDGLHGCLSHRTICSIGRDIFFWSDVGPCIYRNDQVIPLATDAVLTALLGRSFETPNTITKFRGCYADPFYQVVVWLLDITDEALIEKTVALAYSLAGDRFSFLFDEAPSVYYLNSGSLTADSDLSYPEIVFGGLPMDPQFCGNQAVLLYQKNGGGRPRLLTFQAGDRYLRATTQFRTGFMALGGHRAAMIQRIRPVFRGYGGAYSSGTVDPYFRVHVWGKNDPWSARFSVGSGTSVGQLDSQGFLPLASIAQSQFQSIELSIESISDHDGIGSPSRFAADIREIEGVEIQYVLGGGRVGGG